MKICIITDDFAGPIANGGIGTAYLHLARFLRHIGHDITVFFTLGNHPSDNATLDTWRQIYAKEGINFIESPIETSESVCREGPFHLVKAYRAYVWAKRQQFDVIHYHDWCAPAFFIAQAKHQGIAFAQTKLICTTHSPDQWARPYNNHPIISTDMLELEWMERKQIEWSDLVVSPSQYMLDWIASHGIQLPESRVIPNLWALADFAPRQPVGPITDIVFFGRLEERKGLTIFCKAIKDLVERTDWKGTITFLGKPGLVESRESTQWISAQAAQWPWQTQLLTTMSYEQAIAYLRQPGRLAVVASLMDNAPYTVLECTLAEIPMVATNVGGVPEFFWPDTSALLVEPTAKGLRTGIETALHQTPPIPELRFARNDIEALWQALHEEPVLVQAQNSVTVDLSGHAISDRPLVSVVVVTHDRPNLLRQALYSLEQQTYDNIEIVVVDDASETRGQRLYLDRLTKEIAEKQRPWQVIRKPKNEWLGAARNTGWRAAKGSLVMFMDDDNYAKPHEIETFVRVFMHTNPDVVTCCMDVFQGDEPPTDGTPILNRWVPIGPAVAAGAFRNVYGDANALWRKSALETLMGFTEDYGVGHEDWELYGKAALMGCHLEACPEALFFYRASDQGMLKQGNHYQDHKRNLRPYLEAFATLGPDFDDLLEFAVFNKYYTDGLKGMIQRAQRRQS